MVEYDTRTRVNTPLLIAADGGQTNSDFNRLNFRTIKLRLCLSLPRSQAMLRLPVLKRSVVMSQLAQQIAITIL